MGDRSAYSLQNFEVRQLRPVADDIYELVLHAPEVARSIEPGQFVNVAVPGDHSHLLRIPLSFASADADEGDIRIVFAAVGEGTRRLAQMRPGERSNLLGPLGHGWRMPARAGRVLLVAGGVGLPPVVACAHMLASQAEGIDVVAGAQTASRLWREGVSELADVGCQTFITTDDGSLGSKGFTTEVAARLVGEQDYAAAYACGPQPMMAGLARVCAEAHIALQVSLERMMTCGFGACNTCNVALAQGGYASCCSDGPVFDAAEVAW